MKYVIFGLSITSSWGNGHATTYRSLVKEIVARGHDVSFFERETPWYAANRDLPAPPFGRTILYSDLGALRRHVSLVRDADVVIVGSYVPDGVAVARWVIRAARGVKAFYDIDTPITLAGLERGSLDYLSRELVPRFDLYLSFTGGPTLDRLSTEFEARLACPLYCSVDTSLYYPEPCARRWCLGYLGTYSEDRQPALSELLVEPAKSLSKRRFVVAGPQYPECLVWPENVQRKTHVAPFEHRKFYAAQRFTLNVTRREMVRAGFSPSVRLFEAAASGTPIISDYWCGIDTVFVPGKEILIARSRRDVQGYLIDMNEEEREAVAKGARARVLAEHTAAHRAAQLDRYVLAVLHGSAATELSSAALESAQDGVA